MKKRISRIICTLLCCAPIAISAQTSEKITSPVNLYKEGKELFQEKNYAAAIPALKTSLSNHSGRTYVIKIPTKEGMIYDPKKTVAHDKRWVIE